MKNLSALFLMLVSPLLLAGHNPMGAGSSGGGMVVSCKAANGEVVELLDVYEAQKNPKLIVIPSSGSFEKDYRRTYKNMMDLKAGSSVPESEELDQYIQSHLDGELKLVKWIDDDLESTNDQGNTIALPANCQLKQIAVFTDSKHSMVINKPLWNKLSSLSQAALMLHEEFYFEFRQLEDKTSEVARSYVGQAIAKLGAQSAYENTRSFKTKCYARNDEIPQIGVTDFFLDVREVGPNVQQLTLRFTSLLGRNLLTKTSAEFIVKNAELIPSLMDGLDYNKKQEINQSSNIETLLGNGYAAKLKLSPWHTPELQFFKDGKSLGAVEIRSCD